MRTRWGHFIDASSEEDVVFAGVVDKKCLSGQSLTRFVKKFTNWPEARSQLDSSPRVWVGMAKKMSIEEILAAARAQKAGGAPVPASDRDAERAADSGPVPPPVGAAAAAPKPAAKPGSMSVADILAAARASKGAAAPAVAASVSVAPAKSAPPKAAPKPAEEAKAPVPVAAGPKDTASILAAARKSAKPGPMSKAEAAKAELPSGSAAKKKLEVPPMPAKPDFAKPRPAVPTAPSGAAVAAATRRGFMGAAGAFLFGTPLAIGFTSLAVTHLAWVLGLARFMFPNILTEPPTRFKVGFPDAYGPGQVETKYIPQFGVWIVRYEVDGQPMIYALKSVCTHLGCTPNWLEAEQKFKCPCHGSGFYKDGVNFEGPAPRPLERYAISLADDGQLEVDKSRTFQQEMGQWKDSASFVPV